MKATQLLHNLDQSLWLDNITRDLLNSGTLKRYVDELSVTGLTSNPTISEGCPRQREITDIMSADGGDYDTVLDQFATAGIDICDLAAKLQDEGAKAFVSSWNDLMNVIASKSSKLAKAS